MKYSLVSLSIFLICLAFTGQNRAQTTTTTEGRGATVTTTGRRMPPPAAIRDFPPRRGNASPVNSDPVPAHIAYKNVFRLALMGWSAQEERGFSPLDALICRAYKNKNILNNSQEKFLKKLAEETLLEEQQLNEKADLLIKEFRAKTWASPPSPNSPRPLPPPELEELSKQRTALFETSIDKLKENLGEKTFARFNDFVNENIRSKTSQVRVNIPN